MCFKSCNVPCEICLFAPWKKGHWKESCTIRISLNSWKYHFKSLTTWSKHCWEQMFQALQIPHKYFLWHLSLLNSFKHIFPHKKYAGTFLFGEDMFTCELVSSHRLSPPHPSPSTVRRAVQCHQQLQWNPDPSRARHGAAHLMRGI